MVSKFSAIIYLCFIISALITMIFVGIYVGTGNTVKTYNKINYKSIYNDWLPNENKVTFTKKLTSQWHWRYVGDNEREFVQVCSTWNHDSVYRVNDELITYYDNKVVTGRQRSYLRDNIDNILYTVESGSVWETVVNQNKIKVKFIIKKGDKNGDIVAYISGVSFVNDNFVIKDVEGNTMITMSRNKISTEWKWIFDKTEHNTLPLSLLTGIASKISFSEEDKTDACNNLWQASLVVILIFSSIAVLLIVLVVVIGIQSYFKSKRNNVSNTITIV
jgi:hypothetical protein